jgi:hypothetical protein
MDVRERYGEDPVRLGNVGRGVTFLAGVLFATGWIAVVYSVATQSADGGIFYGGRAKALQIVSLGGSVTLATSALALVGVALRMFGVWLETRAPSAT